MLDCPRGWIFSRFGVFVVAVGRVFRGLLLVLWWAVCSACPVGGIIVLDCPRGWIFSRVGVVVVSCVFPGRLLVLWWAVCSARPGSGIGVLDSPRGVL